ncbi:MAG TPA: amidohydrolase family protein [Acidimicrobiia bacterium]|nr:amidohydrolase family protein [Acidimicrobiia bacterium]
MTGIERLRPGPIDIHAHAVPEAFLDFLVDVMQARVDPSPGGRAVTLPDGGLTFSVREDLIDLPRRLSAMDAQGVAVQVISAFMDLAGYHLVGEEAAIWARGYNDALAAEVARQPDRLTALSTLPLGDGAAAAAELRRATEELGMVGAELGTRVGRRLLDDPDLEPLWAEASDARSILLLHPVEPLPGLDLSDYGLVHLLGRPAETTIAAARLVFAGVMDRHEGLRLVVVHGGGFLPYQVGRLSKGFAARPALSPDLTTTPSEAVARMYFDTVLSDPSALAALIQMAGSERVLLGSDYPFEIGDLDPVKSVAASAEIREFDTEQVLGGTAGTLITGVRRQAP